jgi:hypothetical protein
VHTRFELAVAPVWEYPAAHTALVVSHTVMLVPVEKPVPATQGPHVRSRIAEGVLLWPLPAGQVVIAPQAVTSAASEAASTLKYSVAQSVQAPRSELAVAAADVYLPAAQLALVAVQLVWAA